MRHPRLGTSLPGRDGCSDGWLRLRCHVPPIDGNDEAARWLLQIGMAEVGEPSQNGFAERLIRTIKEEEVDLSEHQNYPEARRRLGQFLDDVYMHKLIHSSHGYLTPAEFGKDWLRRRQCHDPAYH